MATEVLENTEQEVEEQDAAQEQQVEESTSAAEKPPMYVEDIPPDAGATETEPKTDGETTTDNGVEGKDAVTKPDADKGSPERKIEQMNYQLGNVQRQMAEQARTFTDQIKALTDTVSAKPAKDAEPVQEVKIDLAEALKELGGDDDDVLEVGALRKSIPNLVKAITGEVVKQVLGSQKPVDIDAIVAKATEKAQSVAGQKATETLAQERHRESAIAKWKADFPATYKDLSDLGVTADAFRTKYLELFAIDPMTIPQEKRVEYAKAVTQNTRIVLLAQAQLVRAQDASPNGSKKKPSVNQPNRHQTVTPKTGYKATQTVDPSASGARRGATAKASKPLMYTPD